MAIETIIKTGDLLLQDKDYFGAIEQYTAAIKENPKAYTPFLKRSIAYQRFKNFDRAKVDISEAFALAQERGKRHELAECYFRLALIYYNEKSFQMAWKNFEKAKEYGCQDAALEVWMSKCQRDLSKEGITVTTEGQNTEKKEKAEKKEEETVKNGEKSDKLEKSAPPPPAAASPPAAAPPATASTSLESINKHAPIKAKIREDWYQTNEFIIITIYAKNINPDTLSVEYHDNSVSVSFPNGPGSEYNYNIEPLYESIDPSNCNHVVKSTKLEINLAKKTSKKWPSLESSTTEAAQIVYPNSSKKAINWSNFQVDSEEPESSDPNDFFAKLYKDVDDDTRKAMMKSYIESNGTVLTTDWNEAANKKFETTPPEGMQAKKWR